MWSSLIEPLEPGVHRITLNEDGSGMSFLQVLDRWQEHPDFPTFFSGLLGRQALRAFYWELPPLTAETAVRPFECVQVEAPALETLRPDPTPFNAYFEASADPVLHFPNLGGDADLVVPRPLHPEGYPHFAAFLERAPDAQHQALWQTAGKALAARLQPGAAPRWMSTAGLGVSWLHLRIDTRPKYYKYAPFRHANRA